MTLKLFLAIEMHSLNGLVYCTLHCITLYCNVTLDFRTQAEEHKESLRLKNMQIESYTKLNADLATETKYVKRFPFARVF